MKKYLVLGSVVATAMLLVGGGAAYLALAQTSSTQVTACARPNGDVYLIGPNFSRQTCSGQQVEISWPTLAGAPKVKKVYDGNNQYLGNLLNIDTNQNNDILIEYSVYNDDLDAVLRYSTQYVFGNDPFVDLIGANQSGHLSEIFYTQNGCVGTPFADGQVVDLSYAGAFPEAQKYLVGVGFATLTGESSMNLSDGVCTDIPPFTHQAFQLRELPDTQSFIHPTWPLRVVETQF